MTNTAIKVENVSKSYIKGAISTGTLSRDIEQKILSIFNPKKYLEQKQDANLVWSLKDINFELKQGEALGIIGKNGAGKSTLLKILSRVTTPTKGNICGNGRIASLLEVGTGFHPELSGRENIFLNGAILGMKKHEIKKNFDEIVDFSGVESYIDTPVKRYSSGMYVRLAFAVAAHLESEILIVDEVLAVGDADFQKKCLGKMGSISKGQGRTVLFVSHNMAAVQKLCTKGLMLEKGKLVIMDSVENVMHTYNKSSINQNEIIPNSFKIVFLKAFSGYKKDYPLLKINAGGDAVFEFTIEAKSKTNNVIIGIGINDYLGVRLFTPVSSHLGITYNLDIGENVIRCELKNFMLKPGKYYAEVSINVKDEVLDYYDKGIIIEIENIEEGLNLNEPSNTQGNFIINQNWY